MVICLSIYILIRFVLEWEAAEDEGASFSLPASTRRLEDEDEDFDERDWLCAVRCFAENQRKKNS